MSAVVVVLAVLSGPAWAEGFRVRVLVPAETAPGIPGSEPEPEPVPQHSPEPPTSAPEPPALPRTGADAVALAAIAASLAAAGALTLRFAHCSTSPDPTSSHADPETHL